ncbi:hypothetical protein LB505_014476 [Fusarium chuoi]|nr:hypothetical protein LB505_014476 [Fusarium chuoi]
MKIFDQRLLLAAGLSEALAMVIHTQPWDSGREDNCHQLPTPSGTPGCQDRRRLLVSTGSAMSRQLSIHH